MRWPTSKPSAFLQWGRAGEINLVLPPDLARKLTVTAQQDTGVVLAQADIDQLIARTDTGAVVLSGAARRVEIHNVDGEVVTRDPIRVTEYHSAPPPKPVISRSTSPRPHRALSTRRARTGTSSSRCQPVDPTS